MRIQEITLYRVALPLHTPYRLSYHTFEIFEPIVVEVHTDTGNVGWGEGHISPGSSAETREGGWAFADRLCREIAGESLADAKARLLEKMTESKVAATALLTALEMAQGAPLLDVEHEVRLPLLTPVNGLTPEEIAPEIEQRLEQGFRTFKVKVGKDVEPDLRRLEEIQARVAGLATLRVDANRAFSREDGCRFASALNPDGIELFEQPCDDADWEANAAVAEVSLVPLMLDEPICDLPDIERASTMEGVGFCKLKLKRFGGLERLKTALELVRTLGMEPVLGDGLASEIGCWMEACVAARTIRNAGEFNGFLKPRLQLFAHPLHFESGCLVLPPGYRPEINREVLGAQTLESKRFDAKGVAFNNAP